MAGKHYMEMYCPLREINSLFLGAHIIFNLKNVGKQLLLFFLNKLWQEIFSVLENFEWEQNS